MYDFFLAMVMIDGTISLTIPKLKNMEEGVKLASRYSELISSSSPPFFWAAAPKGRWPVGHRGEFRDVLRYIRSEKMDRGH